MSDDLPVFSNEDAESAQVWICGNNSYFHDDIRTQCKDCHIPVNHRPHAPKTSVKLCMSCASIRRGLARSHITIGLSERVAEELDEILRRGRA